MRPTLLCVLFTLIIQRDVWAQADDFRPTPIPLSEWHHDLRDYNAGTLHETFRTINPPTVATVPGHYWEDALRHSVYLSLVRDKIDQLIAKGDVISPNSKPEGYDSKEIDDHNLWDKIKSAPFDRLPEEEPAIFSDVTIMAKGRLLERNGGFHFAEDERTKEKCSQDNCLQDVRAFWSVKRVRQRDQETSPGKYHYELTFSVISQEVKQRQPYETPIRTFTVKESSPPRIYEGHQEYQRLPEPVQVSRPERAIWVHKNIAPSKFVGRKQYTSGLERIFSSWFSDDDDRSYESPATKYKQNTYTPISGSQYSKVGPAGIPVDSLQQIPYPYRPQAIKHVRPPLQAPPTNQFQYQDINIPTTTISIPYAQYPFDHRPESNQLIKTTRPAVLPTPLSSIEQSAETINMMSMEINNVTRPEITKIHKTYNKYKNTPVKVNYFSDHVRPPVYNAPPGVFVTMDKKPFKPMPPLKLINLKPHRTNKPIDFRPSPQIVNESADQDLFTETDFRPMAITYTESGSSEYQKSKKVENKMRKPSIVAKKPPKKHDNVKTHRTTMLAPDIITVQPSITSEEEIENMAWANILGSFTKTTPMDSQTEKKATFETTTPMTTTTTVSVTTTKNKTPTTEAVSVSSSSTTIKPKRRTRPPPKFTKQEKIKKHKRITTTTSTTTTNTPENVVKKRPLIDFTTAAYITTVVPKARSTSTSTTSATPSTASNPTTTKTTPAPSTTTVTNKSPVSTTPSQPKNKNRFRQSTLILKGTSVKHDRWSTTGLQKNRTTGSSSSPLSSSFTHRRKGSNFQGYISSTTPKYVDVEKQREKETHADHKIHQATETTTKIAELASPTNMYDETIDQYESNKVVPINKASENSKDDKHLQEESKDNSEYIFPATESQTTSIKPEEHTTHKTKSKCKKKKQNTTTTTTVESSNDDLETSVTTAPAPALITTNSLKVATTESDILQDLLNYSFGEASDHETTELLQEESSNHQSLLKVDDEDDDLIGVFKNKSEKTAADDEYDDDDESDESHNDERNGDDDHDSNDDDSESDDDDNEDSEIPSIDDDIEFNSEEDKDNTSDSQPESESKSRAYSFLELMAMS